MPKKSNTKTLESFVDENNTESAKRRKENGLKKVTSNLSSAF